MRHGKELESESNAVVFLASDDVYNIRPLSASDVTAIYTSFCAMPVIMPTINGMIGRSIAGQATGVVG
jgi:hypothetical protein